MKYIKLYRFLPPHARSVVWSFKWQWRVMWYYPASGCRVQQVVICDSRADARRHRRGINPRLGPRIQRRLVQTDWQDYSDSFSYNAKGNGNGH